MKITEVEQIGITLYIYFELKSMKISNTDLRVQVHKDIELQLCREFGINKISELDSKYLYEAYKYINCIYELPLCLWEKVEELKGSGT